MVHVILEASADTQQKRGIREAGPLYRRLTPAPSFLRKTSSAEKTACLSAHCGDFRQTWR